MNIYIVFLASHIYIRYLYELSKKLEIFLYVILLFLFSMFAHLLEVVIVMVGLYIDLIFISGSI